VDLADTIVTFFLQDAESGELKVDGGAGMGSEDGFCSYRLTASDTDTAGEFRCWFTLVFPDTSRESFPSGHAADFWRVIITSPVA
jgi:hypothetical protein